MERNETTVSGTVEYITFENKSNGYCVFQLSINGEELTCVGILPGIEVGETVKLSGDYAFHSVYGHQFKF